MAESGALNTLVTHVWVYESAADREAKRAKMMQDPDWKNFLSRTPRPATWFSRTTSLMMPAAFGPPIPMPKIKS